MPNGMAMEYWSPKGEGAAFELSPILEPLAPFRNQMLVLSGIHANWVAIHAGASGAFLTGTPRGGRTRSRSSRTRRWIKFSPVISAARHRSPPSRWPSILQRTPGACTGNLSCVYTHTLSWRSPTQPLPMEWNPRAVFEKLFGDSGSTGRAAREARMRQHKSILDSVNEKLASLRAELGPTDQVKVEQYTEAVRDVERRIQKAEPRASSSCRRWINRRAHHRSSKIISHSCSTSNCWRSRPI